jgi:dCTP deaminase
MLLSNTAIFHALNDGRLTISPEPSPRHRSVDGSKPPYDSTAINLRLGNLLRIPRNDMSLVFDIPGGNISDTLRVVYEEKILSDNESYNLQPGKFVLANTREFIKLPGNRKSEWANKPLLAARVEGKSSFARVGLLVHFTAPTIHCGFEGQITLEIICLGKYPVILKPGMQICQLLVEEVSEDPSNYVSQFQSQTDPAG